MIFCCDDVSVKYQNQLYKLERLKEQYPNFKVNCFVIADRLTPELIKWLSQDWIEIGVHAFKHDDIPEGDMNKDERDNNIKKALSILKPLLPEKYTYRSPGYQMTGTMYSLMKQLGFWAIAHQTKIQPLKEIDKFKLDDILLNTHIYDEKFIFNFPKEAKFHFISERFD